MSNKRCATIAILAVLSIPGGLSAQATTGSISGTVIDESKAIMPGVTITVKNPETGLERTRCPTRRAVIAS